VSGNSIGKRFVLTCFGESHGACVGVVVDGCPAGHRVNLAEIQGELDRRKPGQSSVTTSRNEEDKVEVLSGVFNGYTTGAPICMMIRNSDAASHTYHEIKDTPRPGHADYPAAIRYGGYHDYRGGGRFSGRNTVGMVMAGALAKQVLSRLDIKVIGYTKQIGETVVPELGIDEIMEKQDTNPVRCPHAPSATEMVQAMVEALAPLRPESQRQVILLTDGYIGFESEVIGQVLHRMVPGARLHAVGIGAAPNRTLTRGAARAGRGVEILVGDDGVGKVAGEGRQGNLEGAVLANRRAYYLHLPHF